MRGKVTDVIDVRSYTYVEVDTGSAKIWAAAPTTVVKLGETVTFSTVMPMKDFYSDSINRNFPLIYFVNRLGKGAGAGSVAPSNIPSPHSEIKPVRESMKGIEKVQGGKNIMEIHTEKDSLSGKRIRVRGKVTRFSAEVMGKNWLHIQDSSGLEDLTITTGDTVDVGDIVIVEGILGLDKDFGYGYLYPVILEEAKVTKE